MNDRFRTLQCAFAGFDLFTGNVGGIAVSFEFLQARGNYFGEMGLLVALRNSNSLVNLSIT